MSIIGVHVHPTEISDQEILSAFSHFELVRMQCPKDVGGAVRHYVDISPPTAKWLLILDQNQPDFDTVKHFRDNPKVVAWQIGNEPDNPSFSGWAAKEYYNWLVSTKNSILSNGGFGSKKIVAASSRSITQNYPNTIKWNRNLVNLGLLDLVDVFAFHLYGSDFDPLSDVRKLFEKIRSLNKEIWITETGAKGTAGANYFQKVQKVCTNRGINPDVIVRYAWIDKSLGYHVKEEVLSK